MTNINLLKIFGYIIEYVRKARNFILYYSNHILLNSILSYIKYIYKEVERNRYIRKIYQYLLSLEEKIRLGKLIYQITH